jgi:UDP-N-acetylglucosamine diphosphorylase/glucosamine-1-phosphate N-acetyltransferase
MKVVLDDIACKENLYPFTATRSLADIRIGILTIREKWERMLNAKVCTCSEIDLKNNEQNYLPVVAANVVPSMGSVNDLLSGRKVLGLISLEYPWHIFQHNDKALREDFELICSNGTSQQISETNKIISPQNIFIEEGAIIEHCILNASAGPIYIGRNAEVMEGCTIRGPFAMCEGSVLKMGAKIYGATTLGPCCIAGGEIKNSVMFGYSNKAHDGYLGDSVIGEWCNLGAGTSNSNLKNTAGVVKAWANAKNEYVAVGTKCGLLMGDYSRSAINTSFNTGTVTGVCSNIFGTGFPPKYIPDFTWGSEQYILENALRDIDNWKQLKGKQITGNEIKLLTDIYYSQKIKHA